MTFNGVWASLIFGKWYGRSIHVQPPPSPLPTRTLTLTCRRPHLPPRRRPRPALQPHRHRLLRGSLLWRRRRRLPRRRHRAHGQLPPDRLLGDHQRGPRLLDRRVLRDLRGRLGPRPVEVVRSSSHREMCAADRWGRGPGRGGGRGGCGRDERHVQHGEQAEAVQGEWNWNEEIGVRGCAFDSSFLFCSCTTHTRIKTVAAPRPAHAHPLVAPLAGGRQRRRQCHALVSEG